MTLIVSVVGNISIFNVSHGVLMCWFVTLYHGLLLSKEDVLLNKVVNVAVATIYFMDFVSYSIKTYLSLFISPILHNP